MVIKLVKKEQEEYRSKELIEFKEMQVFEAEDFKNLELIRLRMEEYEAQEIKTVSGHVSSSHNAVTSKADTIKQGFKMLSSSITTATVAIGAGIVGAIPLFINEPVDFGSINVSNYIVNYNFADLSLGNELIINLDNKLTDGYYFSVTNTQNEEVQFPNSKYVKFSDIGNDDVIFKIIIYDENDKE